ncbi:MAG: pantetheine-phosphate adenylyltransferase [Oscillospiraceae bacterium]|nr:pantetheine-phosphate adenylyltransferase [Oscillospiraceae bacterium]
MKIAVCPGSFDPITVGHLDIIKRAAAIFDKVIVVVAVNPQKTSSFTPMERMELIRRCIRGLDNVAVDMTEGLIVDYVKRADAGVVVKGLRAMTDFEYEFQMSLINRSISGGVETVFMTASAEHMYLSSSAVKQVAYYGGDISAFVPAEVHEDIKNRLTSKLCV